MTAQKKFVIHFHESRENHYDLMFENNDSLMTWQISEDNFDPFLSGEKVGIIRIDNHRREYLDYEGTISCSRGRVKAFDRGKYEIISFNDQKTDMTLCGEKIKGNIKIIKDRTGRQFILLTRV